ncbi:MAG: contractile injection system protein, VgrG/Pvc8 family [Azonexus sp.]|nr:contractile injection system protein, VgrG/Pvc8 family [Azonexus sp.]MDZ4313639.1 contractile injection system protein, VgrG/Pvc8 family [Azonexus sp.]
MSLFNAPPIEPHPQAIIQLVVDGISLDSIIRRRLISLTHTDNRGFEADTVELELDDSDGKLALPSRGVLIELAFGWATGGLVAKGSYTVDEVAHNGAPDTLSIRARSADLAAGLTTQRERTWHATTLGAIVRTIADENDLKPAITDNLAGIEVTHLDQTNESAANLLTRLSGMYDAICTVKDGRLLFIPAGEGRTASGQRIPAVIIRRSSGDRHQFAIADRATYQGVRATYNDLDQAVKGEVIWGDKEHSSETGKPPAPPPAPVVGQYKPLAKPYPTRKKAILAAQKEWKRLKANKAQRAAYVGVKAKYNDRNLSSNGEITYGQADEEKKLTAAQKAAKRDQEAKEQREAEPAIPAQNAFERTAENVKTLRHVYASKNNATRAARAEWRRLQRGMATFAINLAKGDPTLYPETPATVTGFKPQIDNTDWIITKVTNTLTADGGYTQRLDFEIKATEIPD